MDTTLLQNNFGTHIKTNEFRKTMFLILLFLATNILKITYFNIFMLDTYTLQTFLYKLCITLLLETVVYLLIFSLPSRLPFLSFYILQTLYVFINLVYYWYFHSYLHIFQALTLASEGIKASRDLSVLINPRMLVAILDLPAAGYLVYKYRDIESFFRKSYRAEKLILISFCILFIGLTWAFNCFHNYSIKDIAKTNNSTSEKLMVQRYGTLANGLADMALNKNTGELLGQLKYGRPISAKKTETVKPNFVMIQVESLDSNAVNKQHDGKYVMPFLHSLSEQSIYYPYMLSYHEAGGTSDSEFSVINSMEPLEDYPVMEINDYNYPNSIVRQLTNNSYSTAAFHGNDGSYYSRDTAYLRMGYQNFFDINRMGLNEIGWGAPDGDMFNFIENQMKNIKQPFFTYAITMTSHGPFTNANGYYNNTCYDDVKNQVSRNYMNSLSYVDQSLENYINYIRTNYKNTYIFIWGDHTPDVNNSDYKQASYTASDRYFEFVPLIIVTPDNKVYKEEKIAASFIDIAPTVAEASGISYNIDSDGINLLANTNKENTITFRGRTFNRSDLYSKISVITR